MTATSHAIIGASISLAVAQPAVALPLAFLSHFVADALPHIGLDEYGGHAKKTHLFHRILAIDAAALSAFFGYLVLAGAPFVTFGCVILAGSPDVIWAYRYVIQERRGKTKPAAKSLFSRFHSKIQWSQTLRGGFLEIPLSLLLFVYIVSKL